VGNWLVDDPLKNELFLTAAFAPSLFPNCLKFSRNQWTGHGGKGPAPGKGSAVAHYLRGSSEVRVDYNNRVLL
jgi:hypothetical protein